MEPTNAPLEKRVRTVRILTGAIALVLVLLLVLIYAGKRPETSLEQKSMIADFYATVLDGAQSFFGSERAIIDR